MIVLDTHAWLWWVTRDDRLSGEVASRLDAGVGISAMSCYEVAQGVRRGRIALDGPSETWIGRALAPREVTLIPVDVRIATTAAMLGDGFHGDPGDRIIYATARVAGVALATKDRRIRGFDPVGTLW